METSNRGKTQALRKRIQNHGLEKILKKEKKGTLRHYYFSKWGERFYSELLCIHKLLFRLIFHLWKENSINQKINDLNVSGIFCLFSEIWFQNKILIFSKALSVLLTLFWFRRKWQHFWKKWGLRNSLLKMNGLLWAFWNCWSNLRI